MGYVGLPLAVAFAAEGHDVVAVDVDRRKIDALRRGESYIEDVSDASLAAVAGRIEATIPLRRRSPAARRSSSACRRR